MVRLLTSISVAGLAAAFCAWQFQKLRSPLKADSETTKDFVVGHVPLGSTIEAARSYMTKNGFQCRDMKDDRFYGQSFAGQIPTGNEKADFLWCFSGERWYFYPIITKQWQIIFISKIWIASGVGLTGI